MNFIIHARNWTLALAGGGAVLMLLILLLRLPVQSSTDFLQLPPLDRKGALRTSWNGNQPDASVVQEARLRDPTALFMPTPLSVTSKRLTGNTISDKFPALTPEEALKFRPLDLRMEQLPSPVTMPASPAEALEANPPGNLAMGFGRTDQVAVPVPVRQAWVKVTVPGSGEVVLRTALPAGAVPDLPGSNWEPVFFSATVNAAGLVGSVIPMPAPPGDGGFLTLDAETAQELANYLETKLVLGQRLAPGFYRISIGP